MNRSLRACFLVIAMLGVSVSLHAEIRAPKQPASGPGGSEYKHKRVTARHYGVGGTAYWIFEPAIPSPTNAPLIIFNHGWSAVQPAIYGAWIDHLVYRGNLVVFPVYQSSLSTPAPQFTPNAIAAVKDAIRRLQTEPGHVKPQLAKCAVVGHSMGGIISANMAALWSKAGIPQPRAVMCVEPGNTWMTWTGIKLEDLSLVATNTLLLSVAADSDTIVRDIDAKRIYNETTRIPSSNKNYVVMISDAHGEPALAADHLAPIAFSTTSLNGGNKSIAAGREAEVAAADLADALDYYGTWKLFDGLSDAAFYGHNRKYALGNTPEQRGMGKWSDGTAVQELRVLEKP